MSDLIELAYEAGFSGKYIVPRALVFEDRVKLLCFYCRKYNTRKTCPPRIPDLDWRKIVREYDRGMLIYRATPFDTTITPESRVCSTLELYQFLKTSEEVLHRQGYPLAVSFGGGSCKLCVEGLGGCVPDCKRPEDSRIPIEAIGVNVQRTLEGLGISIKFPPENEFLRVGVVLW